VHEVARGVATQLAALDRPAHAATKLRARGRALDAIRSAIDADMAAFPVWAPAS
jgi:translation initiation factor IF-2